MVTLQEKQSFIGEVIWGRGADSYLTCSSFCIIYNSRISRWIRDGVDKEASGFTVVAKCQECNPKGKKHMCCNLSVLHVDAWQISVGCGGSGVGCKHPHKIQQLFYDIYFPCRMEHIPFLHPSPSRGQRSGTCNNMSTYTTESGSQSSDALNANARSKMYTCSLHP